MTRPTILDLDLVVVPREATDAMLEAAFMCVQQPDGEVYSAMLSASPYPTAWDDVRKYVEGLERLFHENGTPRFNAVCARAEAAEARIAELEKEKHAALTMIAMVEKRLADAERVIEPFAKASDEADALAGHDGPTGQFVDLPPLRAARAYMEGK